MINSVWRFEGTPLDRDMHSWIGIPTEDDRRGTLHAPNFEKIVTGTGVKATINSLI